MKKVSIIIPTFNQSEYIFKTIKSALMQNYDNLEVIVVDDASTDNTFDVISNYLIDKRFKYVKNEKNLGRVLNYRSGLYIHATGDYVLNLDGDDYLINENFIKDAVDVLDVNPNVVFYIAKCTTQYNNANDECAFKSVQNSINIISGKKFVENFFFGKQFFYHLSCLYRRENAIDLDFYKIDSVWTDGLSLFNLACSGDVAVSNVVAGVWRLHGANESRKFHRKAKFAEIFQVVDYIEVRHPSISKKAADYFRYINAYDFIVSLIKNKEVIRLLKFSFYVIKNKYKMLFKYWFIILIRIVVNSSLYLKRRIEF